MAIFKEAVNVYIYTPSHVHPSTRPDINPTSTRPDIKASSFTPEAGGGSARVACRAWRPRRRTAAPSSTATACRAGEAADRAAGDPAAVAMSRAGATAAQTARPISSAGERGGGSRRPIIERRGPHRGQDPHRGRASPRSPTLCLPRSRSQTIMSSQTLCSGSRRAAQMAFTATSRCTNGYIVDG